MNLQRTLAKPISFSGIGLHSGKPIQCELRPARTDTGIVFILEQQGGSHSRIPARFKNIGALSYNTGLHAEGQRDPDCRTFIECTSRVWDRQLRGMGRQFRNSGDGWKRCSFHFAVV